MRPLKQVGNALLLGILSRGTFYRSRLTADYSIQLRFVIVRDSEGDFYRLGISIAVIVHSLDLSARSTRPT